MLLQAFQIIHITSFVVLFHFIFQGKPIKIMQIFVIKTINFSK